MQARDIRQQLFRLKVTIVALLSILGEIGSLALNTAIQQRSSLHWPIGSLRVAVNSTFPLS